MNEWQEKAILQKTTMSINRAHGREATGKTVIVSSIYMYRAHSTLHVN